MRINKIHLESADATGIDRGGGGGISAGDLRGGVCAYPAIEGRVARGVEADCSS